MEEQADSARDGSFPVTVQAEALFGNPDARRVDIAAKFPWSALKREWKRVNLYATVAVLGMVYDKDGALAARFSDIATTSPWNFYRGPLPPDRGLLKEWELAGIPSRYETQIDLPPGNYRLKLVVTDGEKFGRVEVPLIVDGSSQNAFAISGMVLCRRFREVPEGAQAAARPPRYVPLVSNGIEFTPAGDMRLKKGDPLIAYFEVYEPVSRGAEPSNVQLQMRVTNTNTGVVMSDSVQQLVEPDLRRANPVIPISWGIALDQLPPGEYRLQLQASDFGGKNTIWRATNFTVE